MILATGAKFLMLASEYSCLPALDAGGASGDDDEEAWDMIKWCDRSGTIEGQAFALRAQ
jgi:hypothetical protein